MTAAHRLRGVGWFASCVVVVLAFYLVSLQVAAERGRLVAMNRRVADAERDIRALETEFDTRANLVQLEKWNGDTLALTAPVAGQFVADEGALAAIDVSAGPLAGPDGAPVRTAALVVPSIAGVGLQAPAAAATPAAVIAPTPAAGAVENAAAPQPVAIRVAAASQAVRVAAAPVLAASKPVLAASKPVIATTPKAKAALMRSVAVANVRPQAVAMLDRKLLSDSTLGAILSGARAEAGRRR